MKERNGISMNRITEFLEKERIFYTVNPIVSHVSEVQFILSSTRNIIENGIYFLAPGHEEELNTISNSIVFTSSLAAKSSSNIIITVENPQLVHYKIAALLEQKATPFIHPTAIIHPDAKIDATAHIGPYCIIGNCVIGENVVLSGTITVNDGTEIKKNSSIESHTVIGARGMAWIWDEDGNRIMQPQSGGVIIEEDCIIGTGIAIVRGSLSENTVIGKGTVMAHGTKIGHGCQVGAYTHFANNVSLAGNAVIGNRVFLGSGSVVSSNVTIGEGCIVGAGAVVHKSITESYCTIAGVPAVIIKRNNFENKPNGAPKPYFKKKSDE